MPHVRPRGHPTIPATQRWTSAARHCHRSDTVKFEASLAATEPARCPRDKVHRTHDKCPHHDEARETARILDREMRLKGASTLRSPAGRCPRRWRPAIHRDAATKERLRRSARGTSERPSDMPARGFAKKKLPRWQRSRTKSFLRHVVEKCLRD